MEPLIYFGAKPAFGQPSASPFCTKLECFFRLAGLPYERRDFNPMQAPRGKMPYIQYGGKLIPDSSEIISLLCRERGIDLDRHLSQAQSDLGYALVRMLEEGTYCLVFYDRWIHPPNWQMICRTYFG